MLASPDQIDREPSSGHVAVGRKPAPPVLVPAIGKVDKRTKLGRFMRDTERDLIAQLGGKPSAAQRLMVKTVVLKAARLHQLESDLVEAGTEASPADYQRLAWLNSLSRDLAELGLKPKREGKGYRDPGARGDAGRPAPNRDGGTLADYAANRDRAA